MNDLKLAVLNSAPAAPTTAARATAAPDSTEASGTFGDAMAQAAEQHGKDEKSVARRDGHKPEPARKKNATATEDLADEKNHAMHAAEPPAAVQLDLAAAGITSEPATQPAAAALPEALTTAPSPSKPDAMTVAAMPMAQPTAATHDPRAIANDDGPRKALALEAAETTPAGAARLPPNTRPAVPVTPAETGPDLRTLHAATTVGDRAGAEPRSGPKASAKSDAAVFDSVEQHDAKHVRTAETPHAASEHAAAERATFVRDRLIEDFQQRFERALSGATQIAPRSDAGPLYAATAPASGGLQVQGANNVMTIAVPTPVGSAGFAEDFSQRITVLARGRVHTAELALVPPDLGPISVSIEVRGQDATLVFGAAHAATRAVIEDALPRLREMLGSQGLQLADARVGTGDPSQRGFDHPQRRSENPEGRGPQAPNASAAPAPAALLLPVRALRLIDVIV